jgi:hypothetical protein
MTKEPKKDDGSIPLWYGFVRGGLSGFMGKTAVQPLGRWKIVRQLYGNQMSFPTAIYQLTRDKGFYAATLELWRGNIQAATKSMWFTGWFFSIEKHIRREKPEWGSPAAGFISAFLAQTLAQPFDQWLLNVVKEKVQDRTTVSMAQRTMSNWQLFARLAREGILFRGYWMTMTATVPYNTGLMSLQHFLEDDCKWSRGTAGAAAGSGMTMLMYWQDTLRRVRQTSTDSSWTCAKRIYAQGAQDARSYFGPFGRVLYGVQRFYAGILVTLLKSGITNGTRFWLDPRPSKNKAT